VRTELEIDWTDCDVTTYRAFAVQAITIKRQSVWRKSVIPPVERVVARELAPGLRVASKPTVEGIVAEAKTLSREDRAALLEKLKAESDEE
jgi:hypothetical protein